MYQHTFYQNQVVKNIMFSIFSDFHWNLSDTENKEIKHFRNEKNSTDVNHSYTDINLNISFGNGLTTTTQMIQSLVSNMSFKKHIKIKYKCRKS